MTTNVFDDNLALWAASLNALANADAGEAIVSGCAVSKGTGDWESDITAGTVRIGGASVSVSADTLTHSDASGLSAGESRVDIITADSAGALSITAGTGAADPASPDIPADEVVVGFWIIAEGDTTLADSDLFDVPGLFFDQTDPIYGDGSDGSITRSSNGNENGLIYATTYEVESGVTMTASNGVLVVHATESITIDGTLTATGQGAAGGAAGTGNGGNPGSAGTAGDIITPAGGGGTPVAGGDGGDGGPSAGGAGGGGADNTAGGAGGDAGGDSGTFTSNEKRQLRQYLTSPWDSVYDLSVLAGAGGGGGGSGGDSAAGDGGAGGAGGGVIILIAPTITINGTVEAEGADGADGEYTGDSSNGGSGGGGGGGAGGFVALLASSLTGTATVSGGVGGTGGADAGASFGDAGGDGGDGEDGILISGVSA